MSGNASSVTGYLYKDEMPNGTWIVSGHVTTTTHGSQVTRVTSLHNKVYYEVTRSGSSVPHQQVTMVPSLSCPSILNKGERPEGVCAI